MNLKEIQSQSEIWKSNLKYEESIWTNMTNMKSEVFMSFILPVWNESESNLKPIWNPKSQSQTEIKGKVNLTQSETELDEAFHHGSLSLWFHPRRLLLGGSPLGLNLPLPLSPHRFHPGLPFRANPTGFLLNLSILLHPFPLNLCSSFRLCPHRLDCHRLSCAWTVLSF